MVALGASLPNGCHTLLHRLVSQAAKGVLVEPPPPPLSPVAQELPSTTIAHTRAERERAERRERGLARYTEATELRRRGATLRAVSNTIGVSTRTLRRWALRGGYPERTDYQRRSILDPFRPYLAQRWAEGCRNALQLWREIRAQGFSGSKEIVRYHLSRWRAQLPEHLRHSRGTRASHRRSH